MVRGGIAMAVGRLMNSRVILGIRLGVGAFRPIGRAPAPSPFVSPPPFWTRNPINAFYFFHTNNSKGFCAQDDAKLARGKKNKKDRSKVYIPSVSKIDAQHHKSETKVALFMKSMQEKMKLEELPSTALGLGLAGAIPFVLLTTPLCSILPGTLSLRPLEAQAAYGAVILSFLGGPHWGLAMVRTHAPPHDKVFNINISTFRFIWSIVPSLLAWPALLLSDIPKMCLLIFSFALVFGVDAWCLVQGILPPWFLPLRALLTLVVILCLLSSTLQEYFKIKENSRREVTKG